MLKTPKAVVAALVIAGSASAAFADGRFDVDLYRGNSAPEPIYATQSSVQAARSAFAYAPSAGRTQFVRPNSIAVYENGQYVGQDPDINVRLQLQRETPPQ
jgi:hypothetical protein